MTAPSYRVEENGQVLIEKYPGEWHSYDTQYHIRAELIEGGIQARLFDYLNKPATLSGIEISFQMGNDEVIVESKSGIAILTTDSPITHAFVSSPGMRPAEIGELPELLSGSELTELQAENAILGELLVKMELRLLSLEGRRGS
ncbi:hypothetical protein D3P09_11775 [Paenibacillus pinisoli]|uniref:Uncharacterized protein n=1 Tax=Paenibacillus pinisoli TaxID=1276110 RepID=A0A3A6PG70_9BACL|nr:hypothetical protein [Paenibacillus pinisoli]RJX40047.1 hypothetical protein D3P09_11775 [Paenibacillus pinisoli]